MDMGKWAYCGRWLQPTLNAGLCDFFARTMPFDIGIKGRIICSDGRFFLLKKDFAAAEKYFKRIDEKKLSALVDWFKQSHEKALKIASEAKDLNDLGRSYEIIMSPWWFPFLLERPMEDSLKKLKIKAEVLPLYPSVVLCQQAEAAKLFSGLKKIKFKGKKLADVPDLRLRKRIATHIKKFRFCGMHHFVGEPYSENKFFSNYVSDHDIKLRLARPKYQNLYLRVASACAWGRTFMAETSGMIQLRFRPMLERRAKELGISFDDMVWLMYDEMISGKFSRKVISERKKAYVMVPKGDGYSIISGEAAKKLADSMVLGEKASLKGLPAFPGVVKGKAKIVLNPGDINKIRKGDILVAPETTPDFFPAFSKVMAIVTEIGGVTSHAAIIAREFRIPCIIGAKNITSSINDGDLIEVDAINGKIRIIKKAS
jgi:phosphohistidine swiveling domain-containing protein